MRITGAEPVMFGGLTITPGALATSRSDRLLIGVSSTRLAACDRRQRVPELDLALLAGRRRDDFLELDDRGHHREVERRGSRRQRP